MILIGGIMKYIVNPTGKGEVFCHCSNCTSQCSDNCSDDCSSHCWPNRPCPKDCTTFCGAIIM